MSNLKKSIVLCHIVCIDQINKCKLIELLSNTVGVIDLDLIHNEIYCCEQIETIKKEIKLFSNKISTKKKQMMLNNSGNTNLDKEILKQKNTIQKLMNNLELTKKNVGKKWIELMEKKIKSIIQRSKMNIFIVIGSNFFPKDHNFRITIDYVSFPNKIKNKFILDISSDQYAQNQVKYNLETNSNNVITGNYQLYLIDYVYMKNKYMNIFSFYEKMDYALVKLCDLHKTVVDLMSIVNNSIEINITNTINTTNTTSATILYVATPYKPTSIILASVKDPIIGFKSKKDNEDYLKKNKINKCYISSVKSDNFLRIDGNYLCTNSVRPIETQIMLLD